MENMMTKEQRREIARQYYNEYRRQQYRNDPVRAMQNRLKTASNLLRREKAAFVVNNADLPALEALEGDELTQKAFINAVCSYIRSMEVEA